MPGQGDSKRPVLRTSLCGLLGVEYPVCLAGMGSRGRATPPPLVAAVSNAGGLGVLGGANLTPDEIRDRIREVKTLTDIRVSRYGEEIEVALRAPSFLHHQVRNIVGTLALVGEGKKPVTWLATVLRAADNEFLLAMESAVFSALLISIRLTNRDPRENEESIPFHRAVADAILARDAAEAEARMERLLADARLRLGEEGARAEGARSP